MLERIPRDKFENGIYVFTNQNQREFKEIRSIKKKILKKRMRLLNSSEFQMGFTYLRIYKSKSERIQRDKEKILEKG